ncbi:MAG: diaminopimelate epimerase [Chloroflexi bacterium]|nr:diaminopimelate epimerase [Chloroflexota bacterium]
MEFTKMHGAGNDYVYMNASNLYEDWSQIAVNVSDRHKGIGSDGLILAMPSEIADIKMRMFNSDGSEGEMCGNGIRCLVGFAIDQNLIPSQQKTVLVETGAGVLSVTPIRTNNVMTGATVSMGLPILEPTQIPVEIDSSSFPVLDHTLNIGYEQMKLSFISMGNPHAVSFIDEDIDKYPLTEIGPLVENHEIFPNKINFEIVNIIDRSHLKVRVWERGSGITLACGTGACAVAVAAKLKGIIDDSCTISLPGGDLEISWVDNNEVLMTGPIEKVFSGNWKQ